MLAFRIIAAIALVLFAVVLGSFFWSLLLPRAGRMDAVAARHINQLCGFDAQCKVQIGNIFGGDWDTFYEFGAAVPQSEVDRILGSSSVHVRDQERIEVMTRDGRVVASEYAKSDPETPLNDEIEFESETHRDQRSVRYTRDTWLRVTSFPVDAADERRGTYYVLSETTSP